MDKIAKKYRILALDQKVSHELIQKIKGKSLKEQQEALEKFVNEQNLKGDDLSDIMYDLEKAGLHNLKKPVPPKALDELDDEKAIQKKMATLGATYKNYGDVNSFLHGGYFMKWTGNDVDIVETTLDYDNELYITHASVSPSDLKSRGKSVATYVGSKDVIAILLGWVSHEGGDTEIFSVPMDEDGDPDEKFYWKTLKRFGIKEPP